MFAQFLRQTCIYGTQIIAIERESVAYHFSHERCELVFFRDIAEFRRLKIPLCLRIVHSRPQLIKSPY